MVALGKRNTLTVRRKSDLGFFLDGAEKGEILLPKRHAPQGIKEGNSLDVFLYIGTGNQLSASTVFPEAEVGQCAFLTVGEVNHCGAFLDWGIPKQLLVPFTEQQPPLKPGQTCLVYITLDGVSDRIIASTRINQWIKDEAPATYQEGMEVDLLVAHATDIGYKVIVNHTCWGVLYFNEIFQDVAKGDTLKGYIKKIRADRRIDVALHKQGYERIDDFAPVLLKALQGHDGFIPLNDSSSPEDIYEGFGVSKKTYKKAVGALLKRKCITLEPDGIRLIKEKEQTL